MDNTQLHLLLNHFPILGSLFGVIIFSFGLMLKGRHLTNAGLITFIAIALISIPVYLSGEEAEHTVEKISGISEADLEEHEEHAESAIWIVEILGALSLAALFLSSRPQVRYLHIAIAIFGIVTFISMAIVGNHGGKIRHTELNNSVVTP
jgi:uncharacterized membrane protein